LHASTHAAGGPDEVTVTLTSQVTGVLPAANGGTGQSALSSLNVNALGSGAATLNQVPLAQGDGSIAWGDQSVGGAWDGDITDIDETSSTDIGEALADDDQTIVYNTSGTVWVRSAISRVWTYIQSKLSGGTITAASGNVNLSSTTNGHVLTVDGSGNWAGAAASGVTAPPSDGNYYAYKDGAWVDITNKIINP